jgi:hypothetical protein
MNELEILQPDESAEVTEVVEVEDTEERVLEDITEEPGAHIEETQTIEQSEEIESELTEAIDAVESTPVLEAPPPEEEETPAESGPDPDDLPPGSGILEEPHETVEMAEGLGEPGLSAIADRAEVPEGMEFELAGDDGTVGRDDHPMADPSELSESTDDDKDEATPINLPGPVAEEDDDDDEKESFYIDETGILLGAEEDQSGGIALDHTGPGGNVAAEDDWESPNVNTADVAKDHPGPGGMVAEEPEPGPDPFHTEPGGMVAEVPEPDGNLPGPNIELSPDDVKIGGQTELSPDDVKMASQTELSPDDVKLGDNLQPAPEFEAMSPSEASVVEIVGKAISDEEYRSELFQDTRTAITGYRVSAEDQIALGEMTTEAFDFFAAEVEQRFADAMSKIQKDAVADLQNQVMQQVVHAVWRDLNPGGLAYILAYKIPAKHL